MQETEDKIKGRIGEQKGGNNCWLLHAILLAAVTLATLQGWE
jgi:hypothetical protein